jgi:hypothetical protein
MATAHLLILSSVDVSTLANQLPHLTHGETEAQSHPDLDGTGVKTFPNIRLHSGRIQRTESKFVKRSSI